VMKAVFLITLLLLVGAFSYQRPGSGRDKREKRYEPKPVYGKHGPLKPVSKHGPLKPVIDRARRESCGSCTKPNCPYNQVAVQVPPKQPYCCSPWVCQPRGGGQCVVEGVVVPADGQQHTVNCHSICTCTNGSPSCVSACPPAVISCPPGQQVKITPPVPPACCPTQSCEPDVCYYRGVLLTNEPHQFGCEEECTCDSEAITCIPIPCGDPPICGEGERVREIPPVPPQCCTTFECEPDPLVCRLPGGVILQDGQQNVQIGCQICSCASGRPLCIAFSCPIVDPPKCPYGQQVITHPPVSPACCGTVTCG